jgi:hypothetical protein
MTTYKITRFFQNRASLTVKTGLSLEEAQAHCRDSETSSRTATTKVGTARTAVFGPWFDGYESEGNYI